MKSKSMIELLEEFNQYGYVEHYCPICENKCNPTEIDSDKAYCENCDKTVSVDCIV